MWHPWGFIAKPAICMEVSMKRTVRLLGRSHKMNLLLASRVMRKMLTDGASQLTTVVRKNKNGHL